MHTFYILFAYFSILKGYIILLYFLYIIIYILYYYTIRTGVRHDKKKSPFSGWVNKKKVHILYIIIYDDGYFFTVIILFARSELPLFGIMDETSAILKYPEGSSYASAKGYLNNLNADQDEALSAIQIWIIDNNIEIKALSSCTLHPTLLLLRYLRANSFNVEKTIHHITSNLKWREDQKITSDILVKRPEDILGVNSMDQITSIFPHWHLNYDRLGRPVIYKQYGSFDVARLLKVTSIDALMKYHIWEQEMCMEMCYRQSLKNGHIVETVTAVLV